MRISIESIFWFLIGSVVGCALSAVFASAGDEYTVSDFLTETADSVWIRWKMDLQLWMVFSLLPSAPVAIMFCVLSRKAKQRYRRGESKAPLFYAYGLLAPVVLIGLGLIYSFSGVIRQTW